MQDYKNSEKYLLKSISHMGNKGKIGIFFRLAETKSYQKKYKEAIKFLDRAKKIFKEINDKNYLKKALWQLHVSYLDIYYVIL